MIQVIGDAVPVASAEFLARLRRFDRDLLVVWHPRKRRWMVERCVRHLAPTEAHSHICQRQHCCMIEDPEGGPLPLGDHVFEKLASIDLFRRGYGPGREQALLDRVRNFDEDQAAKTEAAMKQAVKENSRDNRRQLLQAITLLKRHDLRVNK